MISVICSSQDHLRQMVAHGKLRQKTGQCQESATGWVQQRAVTLQTSLKNRKKQLLKTTSMTFPWTNPMGNRCILWMITKQPNEVQMGKTDWNTDWTKTKRRNYEKKKKGRGNLDPTYRRGEKQSFVPRQNPEKAHRKSRWEICVETVLTPATGVLFFRYEEKSSNHVWPQHKHWKRPVRKTKRISSPNWLICIQGK